MSKTILTDQQLDGIDQAAAFGDLGDANTGDEIANLVDEVRRAREIKWAVLAAYQAARPRLSPQQRLQLGAWLQLHGLEDVPDA